MPSEYKQPLERRDPAREHLQDVQRLEALAQRFNSGLQILSDWIVANSDSLTHDLGFGKQNDEKDALVVHTWKNRQNEQEPFVGLCLCMSDVGWVQIKKLKGVGLKIAMSRNEIEPAKVFKLELPFSLRSYTFMQATGDLASPAISLGPYDFFDVPTQIGRRGIWREQNTLLLDALSMAGLQSYTQKDATDSISTLIDNLSRGMRTKIEPRKIEEFMNDDDYVDSYYHREPVRTGPGATLQALGVSRNR